MRLFTLGLCVASLLCASGNVAAGTGGVVPDSAATETIRTQYSTFGQDPGLPGSYKPEFRKNNVKINLSSLLLNNYSLSYERSISKKISLSAGYRFMPTTSLGSMALTRELVEMLDVGTDVRNNLDNFTTSNKAYTAELRFYSGRKPGARGMYVALYGRYTTMRYDVDIEYFYPEDNTTYLVPIRSQLAGYGGGAMFGYQWLIAKRVVLDFQILGAHYGKLTDGSFTVNRNIDPKHQANIKEELEKLGTIGSTKYIEADVDNNGVRATVAGPLAGVRGFSFNLGIAF